MKRLVALSLFLFFTTTHAEVVVTSDTCYSLVRNFQGETKEMVFAYTDSASKKHQKNAISLIKKLKHLGCTKIFTEDENSAIESNLRDVKKYVYEPR